MKRKLLIGLLISLVYVLPAGISLFAAGTIDEAEYGLQGRSGWSLILAKVVNMKFVSKNGIMALEYTVSLNNTMKKGVNRFTGALNLNAQKDSKSINIPEIDIDIRKSLPPGKWVNVSGKTFLKEYDNVKNTQVSIRADTDEGKARLQEYNAAQNINASIRLDMIYFQNGKAYRCYY
ncbi:MAG: hypothetical protein KBA61_14500 [Spirochaetes bacterium]|jgi:hypothetical protein|nr:hypothetical protein [Spirochaetota bacterium]